MITKQTINHRAGIHALCRNCCKKSLQLAELHFFKLCQWVLFGYNGT